MKGGARHLHGVRQTLLSSRTTTVDQDRSYWSPSVLCPQLSLLLTEEATSMEHLFLI